MRILTALLSLSLAAGDALTPKELKRILPRGATAQLSPGRGERIHVRDLGKLQTASGELRLVYYELLWGASGRSTKRLFFFGPDGEYLGQISHFPEPPDHLEGDFLLFKQAKGRPHGRLHLTEPHLPARLVVEGWNETFETYQ